MTKFYPALFAMSVLLLACSTATENCDSVTQDRIYQSYTASYDQKGDATSATAQLRFGDGTGTTLALTGKCNLTHDSYTLSKINLFGTLYTGQGGLLKPTHTFTFTDSEGNELRNSLSIPTIAFDAPPSSLSKSATTKIAFSGGALAKTESVSLTITSPESEGYRSASVTVSTEGAQALNVSPSDLTSLTKGIKVMILKRSLTTNTSQSKSVGGMVTGSYTTNETAITIVD